MLSKFWQFVIFIGLGIFLIGMITLGVITIGFAFFGLVFFALILFIIFLLYQGAKKIHKVIFY